MQTTKQRARRGTARRFLTSIIGMFAMILAFPALANAAPVTVVPGLPPIEIPELPEIPGVPTPPQQTPSQPSAPAPPPETTTENPAHPQMPNVETSTGYVALANDTTKQITWWKDGEVVRTMPISMGSDRFPTPNGVYHTMEKYRDMYMDSSTFGVPVDSPDGYRTYVEYAVRMSWSGIFIHAAPWSVAQQGNSNVSRGCINLNTENGKWVYDNIPTNTPIVVQNTSGPEFVPGS